MAEAVAYPYTPDNIEDEDLFDGELHSYHYTYQGSLELETTEEMRGILKKNIERFDRGYRKMCLMALKWHYLTQEAEENPQIKRMFNDLQLTRKLSGSDRV